MAAQGRRPLRIGICAPYDLGRDGGVNSHIRAKASALRQLGHSVSIFGASSSPLGDGEVAVSRAIARVFAGTETGFGADPTSWRRVARLLDAGRFDVLHMHEPLMPLVPWFALLQSSAPVVATFHTHREQGHRWYPKYRWIFDKLMRRVRVRLAVSDAARRTVARHFPGEYEIMPNGINLSRFQQPAARPPDMPQGHPHVLYVGRLEPRKGVDRLIRAMAIVRKHLPATRLVIVGDGPDRMSLEVAARQADVAAHFVGRVPEAALPGYYQAADLVCSPALGDESFGIVLVEAMAAGRPIVATRIAGYEELVADAGCAKLVAADSPEELAREIAQLIGDPREARALGARGASFAGRYDWPAIASRLVAIYLSLSATAL